jgi:4'-phosphopantetheinyl transferase
MPLIYRKWLPEQTQIAVWHISESEDWFTVRLSLSDEEQTELAALSPRKRIEWLAGRWLLHCVVGGKQRKKCWKDEFGKPYLDTFQGHISLSHSADKAAVIVSEKSAVGIDIQYFTEKIERIAHKFMRSVESDALSVEHKVAHLHVYWGAKESLYKAYGKRNLDFKAHLFIKPFSYEIHSQPLEAQLIKDNLRKQYRLYFTTITNFSLTYCLESNA